MKLDALHAEKNAESLVYRIENRTKHRVKLCLLYIVRADVSKKYRGIYAINLYLD